MHQKTNAIAEAKHTATPTKPGEIGFSIKAPPTAGSLDRLPDSLLDYEQLANMLGLTKRGVECLVRSRKIPVIKLGHRTVRFSWARVQQALAKREIHEV